MAIGESENWCSTSKPGLSGGGLILGLLGNLPVDADFSSHGPLDPGPNPDTTS
jgi:hypothetical protein